MTKRGLVTVREEGVGGDWEVQLHSRILRVDGVECVCGWAAIYEHARIPAAGREAQFAHHLEFMQDLGCPVRTRLAALTWTEMRRKHMSFDDFRSATGWSKTKAALYLAGADDPNMRDVAHASYAIGFRIDIDVVDARSGTGSPQPWRAGGCCDGQYFCPTSDDYECATHGGFDVCCACPELHRERA